MQCSSMVGTPCPICRRPMDYQYELNWGVDLYRCPAGHAWRRLGVGWRERCREVWKRDLSRDRVRCPGCDELVEPGVSEHRRVYQGELWLARPCRACRGYVPRTRE